MTASDRQLLKLPFDASTYPNPGQVLPEIYRAVTSLPDSTTHFIVLFESTQQHDKQLYDDLRQNPISHWNEFQSFLSKVYACLAAAQWTSERVLLDVEVAFTGEATYSNPPADQRDESGADANATSSTPPSSTPKPTHVPVVALGGTFDHLHAAHKLLLHLALFLSSRKLIVGVMADHMLASKSNASLVEPIAKRIQTIQEFLSRHGARMGKGKGVSMEVVEITDGYGPTAWDEDIQALVVSQETFSGGQAVNELRKEKGLSTLDMFVINVIASKLDIEREESDNDTTLKLKIGDEIRTLDLSGEKDENRLKQLKMGSTAIRQWVAEHGEDRKTG